MHINNVEEKTLLKNGFIKDENRPILSASEKKKFYIS